MTLYPISSSEHLNQNSKELRIAYMVMIWKIFLGESVFSGKVLYLFCSENGEFLSEKFIQFVEKTIQSNLLFQKNWVKKVFANEEILEKTFSCDMNISWIDQDFLDMLKDMCTSEILTQEGDYLSLEEWMTKYLQSYLKFANDIVTIREKMKQLVLNLLNEYK